MDSEEVFLLSSSISVSFHPVDDRRLSMASSCYNRLCRYPLFLFVDPAGSAECVPPEVHGRTVGTATRPVAEAVLLYHRYNLSH